MSLFLIRHGTTTTSGQTFAGRSNVPLNDEGQRMAEDIMRDLAPLSIERVVSSPLSRAMETARPLAEELGLDIETDPRLMEFDFGVYEGRTKKELGLKLRKAHAHDPVPGGEALIDVWRRAGEFLASLQPSSAHVAVVGHYWLNRMIFGHVSCMDFDTACRCRKYRPNTGSIIELRFRDPSCTTLMSFR
ncbi:histidine phosphatase family protein [Silicimonas sp. MF1-12-2]|uniref:histidine phosphatase family protein n=1 Tax=Silicimonas sp. MF1-12-2 TaxID=3384793 RepID=UPI0039B5B49F